MHAEYFHNQPLVEHTSAYIEFHKTTPIKKRITKCGGQPVWLQEAEWPVSKTTGKPMQFICQIKIEKNFFPQATEEMAYIFMTDIKDGYVDGTYSAEGGENAVIVQPGRVPSFISTLNLSTGPALPEEFAAHFISVIEPFRSYTEFHELLETLPEPAQDQYCQTYGQTKMGGTPIYIQGDETPQGIGWKFLLQINSRDVPFYINLGDAGKAYVFINSEIHEGRMFWQCS